MKWAPVCLLVGALVQGSAPALAQDPPDEAPRDALTSEYENTRWSMVQPDEEFEGGCATGYMALQLRANGYFILNNRISGAWTLDRLGKLRLRTRQNFVILMSVDRQQIQLLQSLPALRMRKQTVFRRCSE